MLTPLILSGGSGARLWPLSRKHLPKPFLSLSGHDTLFQQTVARTNLLPKVNAPIVVTNQDYRFLAAGQLLDSGIKESTIMLEPSGRNTAPAIALGALEALKRDPETMLLVMPADHLIDNTRAFIDAIIRAIPLANAGWLITFGIAPDRAETSFGYIRRGEAVDENAFRVGQFVEKPDLNRAQSYLDRGGYDWNSGIFLFTAKRYLDELAHHAPVMLEAVRAAYASAQTDRDFVRLDEKTFAAIPENSIDYAVMEKTSHAIVIPMHCQWSDIGSWSALWLAGKRDTDNNLREGDTLAIDTRNSLLHSHPQHLIATVGISDLVVVTTPDTTLICNRDTAQDVKKIVGQLKASGRNEYAFHHRVYRPWGSYNRLGTGEGFQIKHITVNPGAALSLQKHHHRAEHWVIVAGHAEVTCDDKVFLLEKNQSTDIPLGSKHRLKNIAGLPLEVIEIQTGSYLGEDDIIRYDDVYGRV